MRKRNVGDIWVPDSVSGGFDAYFFDGNDFYLSKDKAIYRRGRDSLALVARLPARVGVFGVSGKTVLALSDTGTCVANLETGGFGFYPAKVSHDPHDGLTFRSRVWAFGPYMLHGSGKELHVWDTEKEVLKTFRLSEYVADHRWVSRDAWFITATSHRLVALARSDLDRHFGR